MCQTTYTEQEAQQAQTVADRKKRDAESWERYLHEQSRSYPEDLLDIDHGAYRNDCSTCGKPFQGFKRRFTCRVCEIANLKAIVDSKAQKIAEQAKKCTEEELRAAFEESVDNGVVHLGRDGMGRYEQVFVQTWWRNWIECARFLGALK